MKYLSLFILLAYLSLYFVLSGCAAKMPTPNATDTQYSVPNLVGQKQEQNLWCSAAAARMMMSFKTKTLPSQCETVSRVTGKTCTNQAILTETALQKYGYEVNVRAPNYQYVVYSVKLGKPVTIYHYNRQGTMDGSAHAVVAYGTFNKDGKDYIIVYDPWTDSSKTWDSSYVTGFLAWDSMVEFK